MDDKFLVDLDRKTITTCRIPSNSTFVDLVNMAYNLFTQLLNIRMIATNIESPTTQSLGTSQTQNGQREILHPLRNQ